ncbi:hypothetical protein LPB72_03985 [Hydrogenophaga crassostreae]|uniref:DUF2818 domain-containing protein n=1 Tax=Hydrogenophaga crassostreae TaxID=1763535 RepID=A0A162T5Q1_9BURK|nr:DUF2818 family protein [Hydrogenophaga crassostreae]AOW14293.1 hypothetical protein LPB072_17050 [Hydrogenophaga crassostreae]OAD43685.1 hypothetical protein LPB72_03985 [Hydrogenophaga crassostreae]
MNHSFSVGLVLLAAFVGANLPFINNRWIAVIPRSAPKSLWMRAGELVVCYFLVGGLGLALEQSAGQIYPQGWEFYATTGALFLTLAFPGFVFRYLMKHKR